MIPVNELPAEAILRLPQVKALVGLSRSSIYDLVAKGKFPAQRKITDHASGWRIGEIRAWLSNPRNWSAVAANDNAIGEAR